MSVQVARRDTSETDALSDAIVLMRTSAATLDRAPRPHPDTQVRGFPMPDDLVRPQGSTIALTE